MRGLAIAILVGCGCGGGGAGDGELTPAAYCDALAASWCGRYYECYSAEQIAAAGLPVMATDCALEIELRLRCGELSEQTVCGAGRSFDQAAAADCKAELGDRVCSQLTDPD